MNEIFSYDTKRRIKSIKNVKVDEAKKTVLYWMERDQRVSDNWALIAAYEFAAKYNMSLKVVFFLTKNLLGNELRRFHFLINGLVETNEKLRLLNIEFILKIAEPENELPKLIEEYSVAALFTDQNPLKNKQQIINKINESIDIPFAEVDAHNIIPIWQTSNKQEFGARTIRLKINRLLDDYLTEFPKIEPQASTNNQFCEINVEDLLHKLNLDLSVQPISWIKPGETAAFNFLKDFVEHKLSNYSLLRNDPTKEYISNLSIHLHFGHISAQRIALILRKFNNDENASAFLEEMIVRRELSDNFVYYNKNYDNFNGFPNWAKISLNIHRIDKRDYIYSISQFEKAETHDELWNAAQNELLSNGKMHGYMRMYWAKKILEWTKSPEDAQNIAIYLNDKYALDGIDPNGFTGIAWSIGGIHDRAWFEKPIFGKVRYMNFNGAKRKFDVQKYILKF